MDHIRVFASVTNLMIVLVTILLMRNLYQKRHATLFRFLFLLIACHFLYDLTSFLIYYIDVNIRPILIDHRSLFFQINWLYSESVTWLRRFILLELSIQMLGRGLPWGMRAGLMMVGGGLVAYFGALMVIPGLFVYIETVDIGLRIILGLIEISAMAVLWYRARFVNDPLQRRRMIGFALINLSALIFYGLFLLWGQVPDASLLRRLVFDYFFHIFINSALLAWIWGCLRPWLIHEQTAGTISEKTDRMEALGLTPRERDIVKLLLMGCSNAQIAQELNVSEHTVKNAITNIYSKTGVKNHKELFHRFMG